MPVSSDDARIARAIERAHELQSRLNMFTMIEEPGLTGEAPRTGPLSGVPIAVKDLIDQADRVTTCGSAFYRERPERTATSIARLEDAGATSVGRTGLHEFAFGFSSENPHFGPVRNPWDTTTSPGGSSGGSGAAVGAGIVPIAIGTDTGGSVRVPAALCGCFGLKVTYGAIPIDGVFPLVGSIDTVGPLADGTANLELAYRSMSGDTEPLEPDRELRLGIPMPWFEAAPLTDEVRAGFAHAIASLERLGHRVHPLGLADVQPDPRLGFAIGVEVAPVHREFRARGLPYGDDVARRLDAAEAVTESEAEEGRAWQLMIRQRFSDAFDVVDYLLTPTVPAMRKTIGEDMIGDHHYRSVLSWFTALVNHALLPAIAIPLLGTGSPPVSLQVIGPTGSDLGLLALSAALERQGIAGFTPAPANL